MRHRASSGHGASAARTAAAGTAMPNRNSRARVSMGSPPAVWRIRRGRLCVRAVGSEAVPSLAIRALSVKPAAASTWRSRAASSGGGRQRSWRAPAGCIPIPYHRSPPLFRRAGYLLSSNFIFHKRSTTASMAKLSIRDLDLKGKRVFIRVDFNVPLAPGGQEITSDKRIKASLPTIKYALEQGAGLILAQPPGPPKGKPNPEMSLKPVAKRLAGAARPARQDGAGLRRPRSGSHEAGARRGAAAREPALSTPRKRRTIPRSPNSSPRCATSTSTTPSAPRTAPTPPPSA